jgi:hypothetical protein
MIQFRITKTLLQSIIRDLERSHRFAAERVGFIKVRPASLPNDGLLLAASGYFPLADEHYSPNVNVGAMMNSDGIRAALQVAFTEKCSMFHVHTHGHAGKPNFSRVDIEENAKFVPDFFNVIPKLPHGAIVLSADSAVGQLWLSRTNGPRRIDEFVFIGAPQISIRLT